VRQNRGATSRTIDMILPHLAAQGLYIAPEVSEGPVPTAATPGNPASAAPSRPTVSAIVERV
jgi:hypothetical protein